MYSEFFRPDTVKVRFYSDRNFRRSDYVTFFIALIGCSAILLRAEGTWKTTVYPAHTASVRDQTQYLSDMGLACQASSSLLHGYNK